MDYQIRLRDKYLRNFYYLFKKADADNNGIINEEEFVNLISLMDVYPGNDIQEVSERLLNQVDPFNNKQITFNECVTLFSNEIFYEMDRSGGKVKVNLLDKLSLSEKQENEGYY